LSVARHILEVDVFSCCIRLSVGRFSACRVSKCCVRCAQELTPASLLYRPI